MSRPLPTIASPKRDPLVEDPYLGDDPVLEFTIEDWPLTDDDEPALAVPPSLPPPSPPPPPPLHPRWCPGLPQPRHRRRRKDWTTTSGQQPRRRTLLAPRPPLPPPRVRESPTLLPLDFDMDLAMPPFTVVWPAHASSTSPHPSEAISPESPQQHEVWDRYWGR